MNPSTKFLFLLTLLATNFQPTNGQDVRTKMLARAAEVDLKTPYKAPPGDALSHNTSGYAKIMCSAVFIARLKPDFAAENVGYFTSPYAERAKVGSRSLIMIRNRFRLLYPQDIPSHNLAVV